MNKISHVSNYLKISKYAIYFILQLLITPFLSKKNIFRGLQVYLAILSSGLVLSARLTICWSRRGLLDDNMAEWQKTVPCRLV